MATFVKSIETVIKSIYKKKAIILLLLLCSCSTTTYKVEKRDVFGTVEKTYYAKREVNKVRNGVSFIDKETGKPVTLQGVVTVTELAK